MTPFKYLLAPLVGQDRQGRAPFPRLSPDYFVEYFLSFFQSNHQQRWTRDLSAQLGESLVIGFGEQVSNNAAAPDTHERWLVLLLVRSDDLSVASFMSVSAAPRTLNW